MEENDVFLKIENLTVEYKSRKDTVYAVNDISFTINRGKTLGLVGETGAGKTTIAKSILRILPAAQGVVKSGKISVDGTDVISLPDAEMQKIRGGKISMIFQDPMTALNPLMTVGEQIVEGLMLHNSGMNKKDAAEEAAKMLEMVGISRQRFAEYPHQFSGGMKQRVVIAMALACKPELLLADEPTTALDVTIQAQVLDLIKELQNKMNTAMLLITHDLGVVAETCEDVAVIYAGRLIERGSVWEVFTHTAHPYTKGLFDSIPDLSDDGDDRHLNPIPGLPIDPTIVVKGCPFAPRCKYAQDICLNEAPVERELAEGHFYSCHMNLNEEVGR